MVYTLTLEYELLEEMSKNLRKEKTFDEDYLKEIISDVIEEVKGIRDYPMYYTERMIVDDLERFRAKIKRIVKFDYDQIGGTGNASRSENGVSITFVDRNSLFAGIGRIARIGR